MNAPARASARRPASRRAFHNGLDHVRPDFQGHGDIRSAGGGGETHRIVKQRLVGADLHQHRRESSQVGKERRNARVLAVERGGQISARQLFEVWLVDQRVHGVFARHRRSGHRQIHPGRSKPSARGLLLSTGAQAIDQSRREAATGAVAADGDARRRNALSAQKAPRDQRVIEGCGKRMLRSQAIADGERAHSGGAPGLGHHAAVAYNGAGAISATVQEHQHAAFVAAGRDRPFSRHAIDIDATHLDVVGHRPNRTYFVEALSPLGPSRRTRLGAEKRANGVDLAAICHAHLACIR